MIVARLVSQEALVGFEGRQYSVPFAWVERCVEIVGKADLVVVGGECREVARHARHTRQTLVLEPAHYEGPSTASELALTPLGRRARALGAASADPLPTPQTVVLRFDAYVALIAHVAGGTR